VTPTVSVHRRTAPAQQDECDFCSAPARWRYPCCDFEFVVRPRVLFVSADYWAACDRCHEYVERGALGALANVVARQFIPLATRAERLRQVATILNCWRQFTASRLGPAVKVTA
jgi:hypothetical protein